MHDYKEIAKKTGPTPRAGPVFVTAGRSDVVAELAEQVVHVVVVGAIIGNQKFLNLTQELLDFSVDALVFPERETGQVLHTDGLTDRETEALARLIDAMKE